MRNQTRARRSGVLALTAILALGFTACGDDEEPTVAGAGGDTSATTATTTGGDGYQEPVGEGDDDAACEGAEPGTAIDIASFAFSPDCMTVTPGAEITVTNSDSFEHTFTEDNDDFSVDLGGGESDTVGLPSTPGTYTYHCNIHTQMTGTIVVA